MAVWKRMLCLSSSYGGWRCRRSVLSALAYHQRDPPPPPAAANSSFFVRSFAAPVMPPPKPKPESPKGTRINQTITERTVRLVTDEVQKP